MSSFLQGASGSGTLSNVSSQFSNNKFVVEKASISINGISLTIANVGKNTFTISVIEHTYNKTNLQYLTVGDYVNIEFDYLARFILKND